jgi:hypothetical protein
LGKPKVGALKGRTNRLTIPSSKIHNYIPVGVHRFSVYTENGPPWREVTLVELCQLIVEERVRAIVRGSRLHRLYLTVPPDVAGRALGETRRKIKDCLHSDASQTTVRSSPTLPAHVKKHHPQHCRYWRRDPRPLIPPLPIRPSGA